jgi:hypothetical protein
VADTCILIKKEKIHLMAWFARGQRCKTYFCEVDVRNGKVAKHNVWSPKFAILFMHKRSDAHRLLRAVGPN